MPAFGHQTYWSLVGFTDNGTRARGGVRPSDEAAALVMLTCARDGASRQRIVTTIVGPVEEAEMVETFGCPACGRRVKVSEPPWCFDEAVN